MHTYVRFNSQINIQTDTHIHTKMCTNTLINESSCIHIIYAYFHIFNIRTLLYKNIYTHANKQTIPLTLTHTCAYKQTETHAQVHTHTCKLTHTNTCTHIYCVDKNASGDCMHPRVQNYKHTYTKYNTEESLNIQKLKRQDMHICTQTNIIYLSYTTQRKPHTISLCEQKTLQIKCQ